MGTIKRPLTITCLSLFFIILKLLAIPFLAIFQYILVTSGAYSTFPVLLMVILGYLTLFMAVIGLIAWVGIFKLKEWARKLLVFISLLSFIWSPIAIFLFYMDVYTLTNLLSTFLSMVLNIFFIYYFTKSNIR